MGGMTERVLRVTSGIGAGAFPEQAKNLIQ